MMKVLVTGVGGQLGYDVMRELARRGYDGVGSDVVQSCDDLPEGMRYVSMDITDEQAVKRIVVQEKPDALIHCAAWTNVDLAQEQCEQARRINVDGTYHLASACKTIGCKMAYISTDYVFDGKGEQPWKPDCEDYHPLNVYGRTKLDGERAVLELLERYFIVRTAWVFGVHGKNFIRTMIGVGKKYDTARVVCDQVGTPTYTADLAKLLVDMIETEQYGIYHATNEGGYISWYDFCCEFYRQYGLKTRVIPVTTEEYGQSIAARPANSRLDKQKLVQAGFEPLPDWRDAVARYLKEAEL